MELFSLDSAALTLQPKNVPSEQVFAPVDHFAIIDIRLHQQGTPTLGTWNCTLRDLIREQSIPHHQADTPLLRLVQIPRNSDDHHFIHSLSFRDLLDYYHISNETRFLLEYKVRGFYHFPRQGDYSKEYSCFLNNVPYMLLWSFDPKSRRTRGIILGPNEFHDNFTNTLKTHIQLVDGPMLLPATMAILTIYGIHRRVHDMRTNVRGIESTFGFPAWTLYRTPRHDVGIDEISTQELTTYTKSISGDLVKIADITRSLKLVNLVLTSLQDKELELINGDDDSPTVGQWQNLRQQLMRQVRFTEIEIDYLESRAKNQFTVLFNLTNQKDATTNIDIATRVKEDSSAMKTVAIMTMVFLPGTFLAALFAVPSLQWTADRVVTSRFWVYWAITIPMTLAVFAIWAVITMRQKLIDVLRKMWDSVSKKKKDGSDME